MDQTTYFAKIWIGTYMACGLTPAHMIASEMVQFLITVSRKPCLLTRCNFPRSEAVLAPQDTQPGTGRSPLSA